MSKKLMSVILVAVLVLSMGTVAMASVSADELPAKADGYNRYYFYMPENWLNEHATTAGIYWWEGTDACSSWPGYVANPTDVEGLYYYDVNQDVTTIIWNNAIDGGTDPEAPIYTAAYQTINIGSEYYDAGESVNYPDGTDSFDEMIYVVDESKTMVNDFSGKSTFAGEWFYYYGNGEYGFTPEKGDVYFNQRSYNEAPTPVEGDVTEPTTPDVEYGIVSVGGIANEVYVGDELTYTVNLKTPNKIEDVQAYITYDADMLKVVEATTPNIYGAIVNTGEAGTIYFNATEVNNGLDFTADSALVEVKFEVLAKAESAIDITIEEMTERNGGSYFTDSEQVNADVVVTETLNVPERPTEPETTVTAPVEDPTKAPVADPTGITGTTPTEKPDTPPTGANVAIFAALAVVAMAAAAVVVLRKKANA